MISPAYIGKIQMPQSKNKLPAYVSLDGSESSSLAMSKAFSSIEPVSRRSTSALTVRTGMDRSDYEIFRPGEARPTARSEIIDACVGSYNRVSPIRQIMDMMTDFTTQGIRFVHQSPGVEEFYQNWSKQINLLDRSQHFCNNLYLMATSICKRNMGKLSQRVIDDIEKGVILARATAAESDIYDLQPSPQGKIPKYVIPWSYDFLNPLSVDLIGGDLALFAGKPSYGLIIPDRLARIIKNPKTTDEKDLVSTLPFYIIDSIRQGSQFVRLDETRIYVSHYKKNDWQAWANPILYSVMDDIFLLQKLKLADVAAADGAISHIRIWKLGSLEHKLMPTEIAFSTLREALSHAGNGQSLDFIWGPDLTLEETKSDLSSYLGKEKYAPVLSAIYSGLGIPPSLIGGSEGEKGFTNNSLSLKTIIERLNYGRQCLTRFWEGEAKIVQQAMQFRFPARIEYKNAVLTDEAAFNSLLIDLLDRDVIPASVIREHLGYIPEIQEALIKSEWKSRKSGKIPPKAGPFHESQEEHAYKKIFAQTGTITPGQLGIELDKKKPGEKTALESRSVPKSNNRSPANPSDGKGVQGQGRPPGSKDTTTRKTKTVTPRTRGIDNNFVNSVGSEFINLALWAKDTQQAIADIVNPVYLKICNKKNIRQLTDEQVEDLEHFKFSVLCNIEPYVEVSNKFVAELIQFPLSPHPEADSYWKVLVSNFMKERGVTPTIDDIRQIQNYVYSLYKFNPKEYIEGENG